MIVYRFLNSANEVIYVGKTIKSLKDRIWSHLSSSGHLPLSLFDELEKIEYIEFENEYTMIINEILFIGFYKPKYNTKDKLQASLPQQFLELIKYAEWTHFAYRQDYLGNIKQKIDVLKTQQYIDEIDKAKMKQVVLELCL